MVAEAPHGFSRGYAAMLFQAPKWMAKDLLLCQSTLQEAGTEKNWIFSRAFNIIQIFMCRTGSKLSNCCRWNAWNSYEVCNSAHSQWFLVCAVARRIWPVAFSIFGPVICMASLGCESRRPGSYPSHPLGAAGSPSIPGTVSSQHSPSGRVEGSYSSVRSRCAQL